MQLSRDCQLHGTLPLLCDYAQRARDVRRLSCDGLLLVFDMWLLLCIAPSSLSRRRRRVWSHLLTVKIISDRPRGAMPAQRFSRKTGT